MTGWVGFDLDGTLAQYDGWRGLEHIGEPIPSMVDLLRRHLGSRGPQGVRIFTARVAPGNDSALATKAIHDWLAKLGLPPLAVTCVKDFQCVLVYDDRAVQVEPNGGRIFAGGPINPMEVNAIWSRMPL